MSDLLIWVRVGDQDGYHSFDGIEEAAANLHDQLHGHGIVTDAGHGHLIQRNNTGALYGIDVIGTGLEGHNGISFYWGDADAQYVLTITGEELAALEHALDYGEHN